MVCNFSSQSDAMAALRSSQGVCVLLVALLVCQAFIAPSMARTPVVETKKLAGPQKMVTTQGHGGHGHGDEGAHGNGGHGHGDEGPHGHGGHGHGGGGPDGGHKGGHS